MSPVALYTILSLALAATLATADDPENKFPKVALAEKKFAYNEIVCLGRYLGPI